MTSNKNFRTNVHNVPFLQLFTPSKEISNLALCGFKGCSSVHRNFCCTIWNELDFTLRHYCELGYKQGSIGNFRS